MASKLTIKRNGGCLPTLSLLVILLLGGVFGWLTLAGLPGSVLRSVERQAAAAGVPVKIGAVKLSPGSGLALKAEDVSMNVPQPDAPDATLTARKIKVRFSLADLLGGRYIPASVYMRDADMRIPLSTGENEAIVGNDIDVVCTHHSAEGRLEAHFQSMLQGIELDLRASLPRQMLEGDAEQQQPADPPDLPGLLANARPQLESAYREIAAQHWENAPGIRVAVDLMQPESPRAFLQAGICSYELAGHHFRDIVVDANYHDKVVTVNSMRFRTVDPDTEVDLQGGYDLQERKLDFALSSNAPLLYMLRDYLGGDAPAALQAFRHNADATPRIELEGQCDFSEDFALNHISARGSVEQRGCAFNDSAINRAFLSFFLADGNFNLNELSIDFPDGRLLLSARSENGAGHAAADISLPLESLLKLAGNLSGAPVTLPEDVSAQGVIHLAAETDLSTKPFIPGKTRLNELVPTLHSITLLLEPELLAYRQFTLERPSLRVSVGGTALSMDMPETVDAESVAVDFSAVAFKCANTETTSHIPDVAKPSLHIGISGAHVPTANPRGCTAAAMKLAVTADSATSALGSLSGISLRSDTTTLSADWRDALSGGETTLDIADIRNADGFTSSNLKAGITLKDDLSSGKVDLALDAAEKHISTTVTFETGEDGLMHITASKVDVPMAALAPLLNITDEELKEIRMPETVEISGNAHYNWSGNSLSRGTVHLHIPQLVRTPYTVPAFRSLEIPIGLTLDADLHPNADGDICYRGHALVTHKTGNMDLQLEGNLARGVHVTGHSDMRVDTIDSLIDDVDAHSIMRDFRFRDASRTLVDNIDTHVDYSNGIRVASHCDARLLNIEYMQGGVQEDNDENGNPNGRERVRTDLPDKDPLSSIANASCAVDVDLLLDAKNADGSAVPDRQVVTLSGITLEYDNKPWLQRRGVKRGGAAKSTFTCKSILFNLDYNYMVLEEGHGRVYPAYAFGTFYAPLENFMQDIHMAEPVQVDAQRCVFPIAKSSKEPMIGTIRATASTPCSFHFLGTDIPLDDFSGFIHITDDFVHLDHMNAKCWGGIIDVSTKLGITGSHTSVDGAAELQCMDLKQIAAAYNTELEPALCNGWIRFRAPSSDLQSIKAYGEVDITNGDLMKLGIFRPVSELISDIPGHLYKLQDSITGRAPDSKPGLIRRTITSLFKAPGKVFSKVGRTADRIPMLNHFITYDIQDAHMRFTIENGHLRTRSMKAKGTNLNVGLNLDLNLDNMGISGNMWPKITSVPSVMLTPIAFLSKFVINIKIYGSLSDLKWKFGLADKKTPAAGSDDVKPDTSITSEQQREDELPESKRKQHS